MYIILGVKSVYNILTSLYGLPDSVAGSNPMPLVRYIRFTSFVFHFPRFILFTFSKCDQKDGLINHNYKRKTKFCLIRCFSFEIALPSFLSLS